MFSNKTNLFFKFFNFKVKNFYNNFCTSILQMSTKSLSNSIKFLRQDEAIAIDKELFTKYEFSVDQLMELAGLSCAQSIHYLHQNNKNKNILIISGPGNNGGDGLVCARHLKLFGYLPEILYPKLSKNELMSRIVKQTQLMEIPYLDTSKLYNNDNSKLIKTEANKIFGCESKYALIVDAIFGFSFQPPMRAPFSAILEILENCSIPIFSIDIPFGWHVELGPQNLTIDNKIVKPIHPQALISLTAPKLCAKHFKGQHFLGGRFVPKSLTEKYQLNLPDYESSNQFQLI